MTGNVIATSSTVPTGSTIEWRVNNILDANLSSLTGHTTANLHNGDVVELRIIAPDGATSSNSFTIPTPTFTASNLNYGNETVILDFTGMTLPNGSAGSDDIVIHITAYQSSTHIGSININQTRSGIDSMNNYSLDFSSFSINLEAAWQIEVDVTENFAHANGTPQTVKSFDKVIVPQAAPQTVFAVIDSILP